MRNNEELNRYLAIVEQSKQYFQLRSELVKSSENKQLENQAQAYEQQIEITASDENKSSEDNSFSVKKEATREFALEFAVEKLKKHEQSKENQMARTTGLPTPKPQSNNLYEILGVDPKATPDQIKKAFFTASASNANGPTQAMGNAFSTLMDDDKKEAYDSSRSDYSTSSETEDAGTSITPSSLPTLTAN